MAQRPRRSHERGRWLVGVTASVGLIAFAGVVLPHTLGRSGPAEPAGGAVVWSASGRQPVDEEWASFTSAGAPGAHTTPLTRPSRIAVVVHGGRRAYALTVKASDRDRYTPTAQRTELGQGNPRKTFADLVDREMYQGQERWIGEQLLIPAASPTGHRGYGFSLVGQMKVAGVGGPAIALSFVDGRLTVERAVSQQFGTVQQRPLWTSGVVPRDRWLTLLWHIRWSTAHDGLIEVFGDVDGAGYRRLIRFDGWTLKYGEHGAPGVVHSRIGIYRRAADVDTTLYVSGYTVATSRRAAEAAAGF